MGALGSAPLAVGTSLRPGRLAAGQIPGSFSQIWPLDRDWLFGGKFDASATANSNGHALSPRFNDAAFSIWAVWVRTLADRDGSIKVTATHSFFGAKTLRIKAIR